MPDLVVIAGPNGAGKSTAAPLLLGRLGIAEFVNADDIAAGLPGLPARSAAVEAGRLMLHRLDDLARAGRDFAFETTLATRAFAPWIARLRREQGYRFHLFYLWLPDAELAVRRVAVRVRLGGHSVPPDDIRRRYRRGLSNFFGLYAPIADAWEFHENVARPPTLIASKEGGDPVRISDQGLWEGAREAAGVKETEALYKVPAEPRVAGIPVSEVIRIFDQAAREAYARHKVAGVPIVTWSDGRVVEIPPGEIDC